MDEKPPHNFRHIHLSTIVVLTVLAGGCLGVLTRYARQGQYFEVVVLIPLLLLTLYLVASCCEYVIVLRKNRRE